MISRLRTSGQLRSIVNCISEDKIFNIDNNKGCNIQAQANRLMPMKLSSQFWWAFIYFLCWIEGNALSLKRIS